MTRLRILKHVPHIALLLLVPTAIATPPQHQPYHKEWKIHDTQPQRNIEIKLAFALKVEPAPLFKALKERADPYSPIYAQWLSNQQVHSLLRTKLPDAAERVRAHLAAHGVPAAPATPGGDILTATVNVSVAERLLGVRYARYVHVASGATALRTVGPAALPQSVADALAFVAPTTQMPPAPRRPIQRRPPTAAATAAAADGFNTPSVLKKLYGVGAAAGSSSTNRQAVTGFLGQRFSASDLSEFYSFYDRASKGRTITTRGDDGGSALFGGVEAMLDAEYVSSMAHNVSTEFWGFTGRAPGSHGENEPFLEWLLALSNTSDADAPKVISTSYGEDEDSVEPAYAERLNVEFAKAGARGISLLFASGDSGAHGEADCPGGKYQPQWPGVSPYVTSVGGTTGQPEIAVGLSSGGFSNRYPTPEWQRDAVKAYLSQPNIPDPSLYNASGRAFPDIAAQATSYWVVAKKLPTPVDGTSCASPAAAGVISLLNDARLVAGKPTLGFLNPLLYSAPQALNDIVKGTNGGCSFKRGFPATQGWDPVTGLGTPNFPAMLKVVADLP